MDHTLEKILARVQKPGRYVGGEYNAIKKEKNDVDCRFAFCFPDTYEIGMSNLGMRILYGVINEMDGVWCERVFAPWGDMEAEMRKEGLPLYALESGDPIAEFDIIGFSLGYEMAYTNVLNMLELGGIPLLSKDRREEDPIILGGGPCAYNPEPVADFFDIFSIFFCLRRSQRFSSLYSVCFSIRSASGYGIIIVFPIILRAIFALGFFSFGAR